MNISFEVVDKMPEEHDEEWYKTETIKLMAQIKKRQEENAVRKMTKLLSVVDDMIGIVKDDNEAARNDLVVCGHCKYKFLNCPTDCPIYQRQNGGYENKQAGD